MSESILPTQSTVNVATPEELQQAVATYAAMAFVPSVQTDVQVVMVRSTSWPWPIGEVFKILLGLVLCIVPGLIFLIQAYKRHERKTVVIRLDPAAAAADQARAAGASGTPTPIGAGGDITWSDDRRYWWDGAEWKDAGQFVPPNARQSDDGHHWWDGQVWREAPAAE